MLKLFRYLGPYKISISLVFLLVFLQSLSDLYLPTLMSDIVDTGIMKGDTSYIIQIGLWMLAVALAGTIFSIGTSYLSAKVSMGFGKLLRSKVFTHVENFSLQEFDKIGTASLITRTTNDITQVQQVLVMILRMMVSAPMMCVGGIIMALSKDVHLSLVFIAIIPVIVLAIFLVIRKAIPLFKSMQKKLDHLNLVLREGLTGIRVIRSFNRINYEHDRFNKANFDLTGTALKVGKMMIVLMPLMMFIFNLSSIAIIWFGAKRIDTGHMQVGDLMAFLQYATQIMWSLMMVAMMFVMIPRASASAVRIWEVLEMKPDIKDAEEVTQIAEHKGKVEFTNVEFSYPGAEEPAISNISFVANSGEITAIIGGTGSGKSTLINLIPRFYDINKGAILLDDIDIRQLSQADLRQKIGFVPQKALLFSGTIAENIRFGKDDATEEEIIHAATIAQAMEFISEMKDGFNSTISQGGLNVSGGQKQRMSIARALIRKPDVYIFDDSFSALDFKTDALLRAALKKETLQSTVLIVAQRVSTIIDADKIIVLDEGQIVGMGTHEQLMKTNDVYKEIVSSQLTEEEIA